MLLSTNQHLSIYVIYLCLFFLLLFLVLTARIILAVVSNSSDNPANYLYYCYICGLMKIQIIIVKVKGKKYFIGELCLYFSWCFLDWVWGSLKSLLLLSLRIPETSSYWVLESLNFQSLFSLVISQNLFLLSLKNSKILTVSKKIFMQSSCITVLIGNFIIKINDSSY